MAGFINGNQLLADCDGQDRTACYSYIHGVIDLDELHNEDGRILCLEHKVNSGQLADIVVEYLNNNPGTRHKSAALLTLFAIVEDFPCPKDLLAE